MGWIRGLYSPDCVEGNSANFAFHVLGDRTGAKPCFANFSCRDCMKKGRRVVMRYSSRYEKTLPNGPFRCRMELHRTSHAASFRTWPTADPQPPPDPRRDLLYLEKRLPVVASTPPRLP
jgi:hypothetical protein